MALGLDILSEREAEDDERRLRSLRVSAAGEEFDRLTEPAIQSSVQSAVRPLLERETRDLFDSMTAPAFEALSAPPPAPSLPTEPPPQASMVSEALSEFDKLTAGAMSFTSVPDEPDLNVIAEPLPAAFPREAPKPPPDILGRSGPAGEDSRAELPPAPLTTREAEETLDTSSMGGVSNTIASAVGTARDVVTEPLVAFEQQQRARTDEQSARDGAAIFRRQTGREPTPEELAELVKAAREGMEAGFNLAGADVKGGVDDVLRGLRSPAAAEGAARATSELPPPPPVSPFRSDKYGTQPGTSQLIEDIAADTKGFATARGVDVGSDVKSLATQAAEREAAAKGLDPTDVAGKATGLAKIRAEMAAMRDAATTVGDNFTARVTAMQARKAAGEPIDPAELGKIEAEFAQAKGLIEEVFGLRAEMGRGVAEFRRPAEGLTSLRRLVDLVGGEGTAERLGDRLLAVDLTKPDDVTAILRAAQEKIGLEKRAENLSWPFANPDALAAARAKEAENAAFGLARQTEGAYAQAEEAHNLMGDAWKGYQTKLEEMRAGLTPRELALADQAKQGYRGTAAVGPDLTTKAGEAVGTQASLPGGLEYRELPPILTMSREKAINDASKSFGGDAQKTTKFLAAWDQSAGDALLRAQVMQTLRQPSKLDQVVAVTTANMLSSPKTLLVNASGGVTESINRPLLRLLAWQPQEAATDVAAMGQAIGTAWGRAGEAFRTGIQRSTVNEVSGKNMASVLEGIRPNAISGKKGVVATASLRVMGATDEFFYTLNHAGAMAVAAQREARATGRTVADILQNPPRRVLVEAEGAAREATYRGKGTWLGNKLIEGRNLINSTASDPGRRRAEKATGLALYVLTPFVRIPEEILMRGSKMLVSPVTDTIGAAANLSRGNTAAARQAFAKAQLNGMLAYGIYSQAVAGNVTGSGPASMEQRRILEAARDERGNPVWQANSIRIGDRWLNYTNLGPVAIPLAVISNGVEAYQEKGRRPDTTWQDQAKAAVNGMADTILDATYLRTVGDLWKSVQERRLVGALESLAANTATRAIPFGGTVNIAARSLDQTVKEPAGFTDRLKARVPFASQEVPSRVDPTTGQPTRAPVDLSSFISPFRTSSPDAPNPVASEVARLNLAGASVSVPQLGPNDQYAGAKQTPQQRQQIRSTVGQAVNAYVTEFIARPGYQRLSDQEKAATLNRVIGTARQVADIRLGEVVARDPRGQALLALTAVPHYAGIDPNAAPAKIREENWRISNAKALLTEYRQKYGPDRGEYELFQADKDAWALARRPELNTQYLKSRRDAIDKQFGGVLSRDDALLGAGNQLLVRQ